MCWRTIFALCLLKRQRKIYSFARLAVFPKHIFEMYIVFAFVYFCNLDFFRCQNKVICMEIHLRWFDNIFVFYQGRISSQK